MFRTLNERSENNEEDFSNVLRALGLIPNCDRAVAANACAGYFWVSWTLCVALLRRSQSLVHNVNKPFVRISCVLSDEYWCLCTGLIHFISFFVRFSRHYKLPTHVARRMCYVCRSVKMRNGITENNTKKVKTKMIQRRFLNSTGQLKVCCGLRAMSRERTEEKWNSRNVTHVIAKEEDHFLTFQIQHVCTLSVTYDHISFNHFLFFAL